MKNLILIVAFAISGHLLSQTNDPIEFIDNEFVYQPFICCDEIDQAPFIGFTEADTMTVFNRHVDLQIDTIIRLSNGASYIEYYQTINDTMKTEIYLDDNYLPMQRSLTIGMSKDDFGLAFSHLQIPDDPDGVISITDNEGVYHMDFVFENGILVSAYYRLGWC